eukprot:scaffold43926_cov71-Phaeocystis_antarctica.AAC.2
MHVGRRGLPQIDDVVIGRHIPRCTRSRMACESSTPALPTIIIMPTEVPRARRLVWSVIQIIPSAGFP